MSAYLTCLTSGREGGEKQSDVTSISCLYGTSLGTGTDEQRSKHSPRRPHPSEKFRRVWPRETNAMNDDYILVEYVVKFFVATF